MASTKAKRTSTAQRSPGKKTESVADAPAAENAADVVAPSKLSPRLQAALVLIAAYYLAIVWFDAVGSSFAMKVTPRALLYFCQIAALFKNAGQVAIDYRAEGWVCESKRWVEIDVRPWFQIDADNKENRFHRALQFYRKERKVMRELEDYVVKRNNASPSRPEIGGVRFLSLRVPYPALGSHVEHTPRKELAQYPSEQRHAWYWTPISRRKERCGDHSPTPKDEAEGSPDDKEREKDKAKDKDKSSVPRDDKELEP